MRAYLVAVLALISTFVSTDRSHADACGSVAQAWSAAQRVTGPALVSQMNREQKCRFWAVYVEWGPKWLAACKGGPVYGVPSGITEGTLFLRENCGPGQPKT